MDEQTVDLREIVSVLKRHRWLVVGVVGAMTMLATVWSMLQTPIYSASAKMILRPVVAPAAFSSSYSQSRSGPLGLELSAQSEGEIVSSARVAMRVKEVLGLEGDATALAAGVGVRILTDELIEVMTSSADKDLVANLANAFAEQYIQYKRETAMASISGHADDLQSRIALQSKRIAELDVRIFRAASDMATTSNRGTAAERQAEVDRLTAERNELLSQNASLRQRLEDARNAGTISTGGGEIIEPAVTPKRASKPQPIKDGTLGLILGLVLGFGAAFVRGAFDDRIRTRHDAVKATNVPVLAAIPPARRWTRRKAPHVAITTDPGSAAAEAYRGLRQTLTAMGLGRSIRSILVTSGGAKAGKTATAANLAVACAQAGLRSVVVSADLRRPRLHEFFGSDNGHGLSVVLHERLGVRDALVPTTISGMSVLPSGPTPRNPAGLLDGGHFSRVMDELLDIADVVIIDGPPIASGADAMALAPHADLSILVMRYGSARASGAAAGVAMLSQAGSRRQVTVLNMAIEKAASAYIPDPGAYPPMTDSVLETVDTNLGAEVMKEPVANGHKPRGRTATRKKN